MSSDVFPEAKYKIGQRVAFKDYLVKNDLIYWAEDNGQIVGVTLEGAVTSGCYSYTIARARHKKKLNIREKCILSIIE